MFKYQARRMVALLFSMAIAMFLGCLRNETPVQKGIHNQILYIGNQSEPEDLDPHIITGNPEFHIVSALLEGLVLLDPKDLHPIPAAARSWDISDNGLVYTFHLRSDAKWSNGDPVTANDFIFSFKRILSPKIASEYSYMLYAVRNAELYNKGKIAEFDSVGAKAINDSTLVIQLDKPTPYFLQLLAHNSWFPVHPQTILKFGAIDQRGTPWTRAGNFVGNGPFVLDKWEINKVISVKKNEKYWDKNSVRLNEIDFFPIDNNQTEERDFRAGQLHVTSNLSLPRVEYYKTKEPQFLRIDPYLATYYYLVNVQKPPLNDARVRKALALAIDRNAIVRVLKGGQIPADCFTPHNAGGYTCEPAITFDTITAKKLLAEAGYSAKRPLPTFSLLYNTSEAHQTVAQAIQQMWKQYLGIEVSLVNQEWKVYLASTHNREYDVARMAWSGDYNDPNTFLNLWITGGGNNRTGWSNPSYDSLIDAATKAPSQESRFDLFQKAEKILLDQMPILPIYFLTNVYLIHPSVKGWYPNLLNQHPYKYVYLE